ncbi:MAG: hypothetical protein IKM38_09185 [Christensenellaceae bacterium]|nr:hypothetical protein [Christensenellaceae bacterium]
MANTTKTGTFTSYAAKKPESAKKEALFPHLFELSAPYFEKMKPSFLRFIKQTAACFILVLGILLLRDVRMESKETANWENGSELLLDEDLGKLQFISSTEEIAIPVNGFIMETFAENGEYSLIESEAMEPVFALMSGTVAETGSDYMVIANENGTKTSYIGLIPGHKAGAQVLQNEAIGQLTGDTLTLKTIGGIGYLDSLAAPKELG